MEASSSKQIGRCIGNALDQNCSTFHVVRATSAKFGLHASDMKFNTQNE